MAKKTLLAAAALGLTALTAANVAQAFNMGNMMNPTKWFGGDNDHYDRYRYGGPYGYGGPWGWGGPYGYGGGPWGGYPGYRGGYPSTIVVSPQGTGSRAAPPPRIPQ